MKRILAAVLCLCLVCPLLGACGKTVEEEKYAKIGLFEPMTGDNSLPGNRERLGVEYARTVKPFLSVGGESYTVQLVEEDTKSSVEQTVYAARALAEQGVCIALGTYGSTECSVAAADLEAADISALGITCTDPTVTENHSNYYRICYLDAFEGKLLAQYAYGIGARKAYCLAQTDITYDRQMCQYFIDEFELLGGTVITSVTEVKYNTYSTSLNNFADYLYGATTNNADVMFSPIPLKKGVQLLQECAAADVKFNVLGDDNWDDPSIGEAVAGTYQAVSFATIFAASRNEACQEFVTGFQDWLHADPARVEANGGTDTVYPASALAYDAYMVAAAAIEAAGSTEAAAVSAAIGGVVYDGLTGAISFDENGDATRTELYIKAADNYTGEISYQQAQKMINTAAPAAVTDESGDAAASAAP